MAVAMLRSVNLPGHQKVNMQALKTLCTSLGLRDVQTYIQSGNLVFRDQDEDPAALARRLEDAMEASFGFRPAVIVRTAAELRKVIAKNPFAGRKEVQPSKLLVVFMNSAPTRQARDKLLAIRKSCTSTAVRCTSTIRKEWLARKSRWCAWKRRFNAPPPAETGTPLTSYWRWPKHWKAREFAVPRYRRGILCS
jgi:uncharacterized protein (DUF1697 family)